MNFTSFHFFFFFLVTITVGHFLKEKTRALRLFLLLASLYFYGSFKWAYLLLVFITGGYDFVAAIGIESRREYEETGKHPGRGIMSSIPRIWWLAISMTLNLSLLGFFKYTNFGIEILNDMTGPGRTMLSLPTLEIILPAGISFYTFQSMSYTIDVYRGILKARRNVIDFGFFVSFFPQLVAGPIVRATTFFSQMDNALGAKHEDLVIGFTRIVVGFFRKLVLADNLAPIVNAVFAGHADMHPADVWIGALAFGWQIYFDFAGYTDIARGVARLFGFEFPVNFLYPFSVGNVSDHWARWHVSLTSWLRDYLYIPLGGSRVGPIRLYFNLFIVWFATGVWHGAAYHFIAWGVWQFIMVMVHRWFAKTPVRAWLNEKASLPWALVSRVVLFFFLTFGFIWFRAADMTTATAMQGRLFGFADLNQGLALLTRFPVPMYLNYIWFLAALWLYEWYFNARQLEYFWEPHRRNRLVALLSGMVFLTLVLAVPDSPNFLYFQF